MGTAMLVSAGLQGIMGALGGNAKANQMAAQEAAGAYKNTLSIARTRIMNEYNQRAYRRQVDRVREQMIEKFKANKIDPNYMNYFDRYYTPAFTYKALNKLIQGSAADMTKKSMVALYENGIIPHIQIHDEVDISVESDKKAEEIINIMESAVELQVPNKVDYEKGNNWGEIK